MKPFNLEEYLANPSRKVVTREGKPARIICTDVKGASYSVLALVDKGDYDSRCRITLSITELKPDTLRRVYVKTSVGRSVNCNRMNRE